MDLRSTKKGQVSGLPKFFQLMMLIIIFAGLTFIVAEKFVTVSYKPTGGSVNNETITSLNDTVGDQLSKYSLRSASCSMVILTNASNGLTIASGNYTLTGCLLKGVAASIFINQNVNASYTYSYDADTSASNAVNSTISDLYDYGIGFLGIIILVVMVYLIISIISGRKSGAK